MSNGNNLVLISFPKSDNCIWDRKWRVSNCIVQYQFWANNWSIIVTSCVTSCRYRYSRMGGKHIPTVNCRKMSLFQQSFVCTASSSHVHWNKKKTSYLFMEHTDLLGRREEKSCHLFVSCFVSVISGSNPSWSVKLWITEIIAYCKLSNKRK